MTENTSVRWVAGLSNGETLVEGKGVVEEVKGEDSPWHKLQEYLRENDLRIQSFGLWADDKHFNLPSVKPKFGGLIPVEYNCFRFIAGDILVGGGNSEHYICAEAIYPGYKVQLWVDLMDTNKSWLNVKQWQ